jgi:hypothetical protein
LVGADLLNLKKGLNKNIKFDINGDLMSNEINSIPIPRCWMRHMTAVPKSFLRYRGKGKFFAPPFFGIMWRNFSLEKATELRKSSVRLLKAFINIGISVEEKFSE